MRRCHRLQRAAEFGRSRRRGGGSSRASAVSAISVCNTRGRWDFTPSRSVAAKTRKPLARKLGAHQYIDSGAVDTVAELQKLGGARVILATAPKRKSHLCCWSMDLASDGNLACAGRAQ